ncbi:MAG: RNA polymerase sigma factor SigY [Clostridia bacterium]|nr:RNA polymerase sigma factor SigY [Clostridia bacterium]
MDNEQLIELAKKQNKNALSILLTSHYEIVYGYMLKLTLNPEVAKDLTQEVMVKAIVHMNKFKGDSKFSTWLIAIGTNIYKNQLKKNKRMVITEDFSFLDAMTFQHTSTEDAYIKRDNMKTILKLLNEMKEQQKIPFLLKHYYGYSYEEIAVILKIPIGTVRSRIHNTIKKLQDSMKGGLYEIV